MNDFELIRVPYEGASMFRCVGCLFTAVNSRNGKSDMSTTAVSGQCGATDDSGMYCATHNALYTYHLRHKLTGEIVDSEEIAKRLNRE